MILKTCSLRIQRSIFRNFPETTIFVWKFLLFEREDRISCQKIYPGLPTTHFTCPEQHFEKKMIKVNFSVCGFFKSLCDFFSDRMISPGCQNHILGVESKVLGNNFLSQFFLEHFQVLSRGTWEFSGKLLAELSNLIQWVRRNTFTATFLKQV